MEVTLLEVNLEEGSFSASLPFSNLTKTTGGEEDDADDDEREAFATDGGTGDDGSDDGSKKKVAVLGVFAFLLVATAIVRYLSGDDEEPDVEIETPDDGPVGVTVDTEEE